MFSSDFVGISYYLSIHLLRGFEKAKPRVVDAVRCAVGGIKCPLASYVRFDPSVRLASYLEAPSMLRDASNRRRGMRTPTEVSDEPIDT